MRFEIIIIIIYYDLVCKYDYDLDNPCKSYQVYLCFTFSASLQHLTCVTNAASGSGDSIPPVNEPNLVSSVTIVDNPTLQRHKLTLFLSWL